jgi:hypothetical protein
MGLHALVAIDLSKTPEPQYEQFCKALEKDNWVRIGDSSTIWSVSFQEPVRRMGAIRTIQSSLHRAKKVSNVMHLVYAVQVDVKEVLVASL